MAIPNLESWNLVRVYGTWRKHDGAMIPGTAKVRIPARLTTVVDDSIIPAGEFYSGPLNTTNGAPSLDLMVPATDDPDILETGWLVSIDVTFEGGYAPESYTIEVPVATPDPGINLRTVLFPNLTPQVDPYLRLGEPGGLALIDSQGRVTDANGATLYPNGIVVVTPGTDLTAARPDALVVYWKFDAGVDVGTNGANVVNAVPGDLFYS